KQPAQGIQLAFAGDGDISRADWTDASHGIGYGELTAPRQPWLPAPKPVRSMIERLGRTGSRLDQPENSSGIIVGIQTSADQIYHLIRKGRNPYIHRAGDESRGREE